MRVGGKHVLLVAVLSVLALAGCHVPDSITVHISKAQIQEQVASQFPIEKRELIFKAVFEDPQVKLIPARNRIGVDAKAKVDVLSDAVIGGRLSLDADLVYEPGSGEFVLKDVRLVDAHIDDIPPSVRSVLKPVGGVSAIESPFREICRHFPPKLSDVKVGRLPADWQGRAAKSVLRRIVVREDGIDAEVGVPR